MSLREMTSREVCELELGIEKALMFEAAEVQDLATGRVVRLEGPINLDRYGPFPMKLTNPRTGLAVNVPGVRLWVKDEDGVTVEKPLNIVSKRLIGRLHADLESGDIFKYGYHITAIEKPPKTRYQVRRGVAYR